ncbi:MAG: hypothetical protein ACI37O_01520 [Candidatus Avelusimicrobium sp.]|uniref:hypothetical protein n=1 Tax=Candidatus Avelusimicrobium sp. TaxID=3048833 RepID=UPI003F032BE6
MRKLLYFAFALFLCLPAVAQQPESPPQYKVILSDSETIINGLKLKMQGLQQQSQLFQQQLKTTQAELAASQKVASQNLTDSKQTILGLETSYKESLQGYQNEITNLKSSLWWAKIRFYAALAGCLALGFVLLKKMLLF